MANRSSRVASNHVGTTRLGMTNDVAFRDWKPIANRERETVLGDAMVGIEVEEDGHEEARSARLNLRRRLGPHRGCEHRKVGTSIHVLAVARVIIHADRAVPFFGPTAHKNRVQHARRTIRAGSLARAADGWGRLKPDDPRLRPQGVKCGVACRVRPHGAVSVEVSQHHHQRFGGRTAESTPRHPRTPGHR